MKVIDAIKKDALTLSFEFFPPKTFEDEIELLEVIAQLKQLKPNYVSVTYGALGNTRAGSFDLVVKIKKDFQIEPVAHLTCVAAMQDKIKEQLDELEKNGIENILALRGDRPGEGMGIGNGKVEDFKYAVDLVAFIKKQNPEFCIGVAGYPEKHPEAKDFEEDIKHLKEKVDAGANYIVTQMFFDNQYYFNFVEHCRKAGIKVPIIPGIMPVTNSKQIEKIVEISGVKIPPNFTLGAESTIKQCKELLAAKVKGLHFFVLNRAEPISSILHELKI